MKSFIVLVNLIAICLADDLSVAESRPLLKPSGKPLITAEQPALIDTSPQIEYITTPDVVKPAIDYISVPNIVSKPKYEYISTRPSGYEYISTYPGYQSYGYYPWSNSYNNYPRYTYPSYPTVQQRGYQTGYQHIVNRNIEVQRPTIKSYPAIDQTYYPWTTGYQYDYRYYPQYLPSLGYSSYVPVFPYKK